MQHLRTEEMLNLMAYRQYRKGRSRFLLVYGILLYGMPMFCFMNAVEWYSDPFHFKGIWLISWLILSLGFWCVVGYVFGRLRWRSVERRALRSSV